MKIAYHIQNKFPNSLWLGNSSYNLIRLLAIYQKDNHYFILGNNQSEINKNVLELPNVSFTKITEERLLKPSNAGTEVQNIGAEIFHSLSGELPKKWNSKPIKKIITIQDLNFLKYPNNYSWLKRKIYYRKLNKAAQSADLIVTVSEQNKKDINKYFKVSEHKIKIVYPLSHKRFKEYIFPEFLEVTRQKFDLPNQFILYRITFNDNENFRNLIKALQDTGIPLVVIGDNSNLSHKHLKFIKKSSVEVHFINNVKEEDLAAIYRLANIFIYTNVFEGFATPVVDALFSGTPLIIGNVGSLPEAGGEYALYVNPENPNDIRAKVQFLWDNESERKRRREKNFAFAEKFKDENVVSTIMNIYKELS